jgi:S-DNA-T family DNA segregation ATPase FtsK/SpoIIIE
MAIAAPARRLASPEVRTVILRRLGEIGGIFMAAAGVALLVALATYHPLDPSLNTSTTQSARNLLGAPGAVVADTMLQGFGLAGALPGVALLAWAWRIGARGGQGFGLAGRLAALLGAIPAMAAALASVPGPNGSALLWPVGAGLGGAAGRVLSSAVLGAGRDMLGPYGALGVSVTLAFLAALLALLTLGLTAGEWRAAGRAVRLCWAALVFVAMNLARGGALFAAGATWLLRRINGTRPVRPVRVVGGDRPAVFDTGAAAPESIEPVLPRAEAPIPQPAEATVLMGRERLSTTSSPSPKRRTPPAKQAELPLEVGWKFPPLSLLKPAPSRSAIGAPSEEALTANARLLETVLSDYGVQGRIGAWRPGPVVTLYELEPAPGIRSARVIGLADDVARSLSVAAVRIATVSGRNVIGIEVPNARRETVYLRDLLESAVWSAEKGKLSIALGKDIGGEPVIADLARMPHLLVAGTTGSGKSVGINAMILSLLYRLSPEQCRLIMIDPKMLELSVYEGIPHLLAPVVTEPTKAVVALKWVVREMERRYRAMSQLGVRNIGGYNDRVGEARSRGEVVTRRVQTGFDPETGKPVHEEQPLALEALPFIVVVIDEMADLMMVAGKEIEAAVQRLAQMARAAGIHVVMATQRPSVDVITGTIKANFPTRISFQVVSKFDSRTILGEQGAEQLLGMGDMLNMVGGRIQRVHGPFVGDNEVEEVVAFLREQGEPDYVDEVTELAEGDGDGGMMSILDASDSEKSLFDLAVDVVTREGKASTSFIQRHLKIGYNRAASLIEQMEREGIVGAANHVGKREVLTRRGSDEE